MRRNSRSFGASPAPGASRLRSTRRRRLPGEVASPRGRRRLAQRARAGARPGPHGDSGVGGPRHRALGRDPWARPRPSTCRLMLLLDSEAISAVAHGPAERRDRVRALVAEMRSRELPVATVAAVLAEVVRGHPRDAGAFAGLRRERVQVHPVDTRAGVRAGQLLGSTGSGSERAVDSFVVAVGPGRRCGRRHRRQLGHRASRWLRVERRRRRHRRMSGTQRRRRTTYGRGARPRPNRASRPVLPPAVGGVGRSA